MISNKTRVCCSLAFLAWNSRRYNLCTSAFSTVQHISLTPGTSATTAFTSSASTASRLFSTMGSEQRQEVNVRLNLESVREQVIQSCEAAGRDPTQVRLVAVSKTKPLQLVKDAYENGQRTFGENYVQELVEKSKELAEFDDIQWHFIGALQSNKASLLVKSVVPVGKLVVETVSSLKLAKKLNNAMAEFDDKKLEIFLQVNTSGEESKSGTSPEQVVELCQQIAAECDKLQVKGLMTIGAPGDVGCLDCLAACRENVAKEMSLSPNDLELSMGMSGDFEVAIAKGSTNVRVGSTIFGARDYPAKK